MEASHALRKVTQHASGMRKLIFVRLIVENFKSFRRRAVFDLAPTVGLCFLRGRNDLDPRMEANATGKSSLFDALCWCLYGRTPRGLRNPDIAPWEDSDAPTQVTLYFQFDSDRYILRRSTQPNRLTLNNEPVGQADLEDLLGMNLSMFCHMVLFAQNVPLFFDLTPSYKLDILVKAIGANRWEEYAKNTDVLVDEMDLKLNQARLVVAALEGETKALASQVVDLRERNAVWYAEQKKQLLAAEAELKSLDTKEEQLQKRHDVLSLALDGAQTEVKPLEKQHEEALQEKFTLDASLYDTKRQLMRVQRDLTSIVENKVCPLCKQPLHDRELKTQLEEEKFALEKRYAALEKQVKIAHGSVTATKKHLEQFRSKAEDAQTALNLLNPELSTVSNRMQMLKTSIRALSDSRDNPTALALREAEKKLREKNEELGEKTAGVGKIEALRARTAFWVRGFKEVRLFVIEELLDELQLTTNALLTSVGLEGWVIRYLVEKELKGGGTQAGLTVMIKSPDSPNNKFVRWENWSGGEGQRLRLVGEFAFAETLANRVGVEPNLEIMDEPSNHISDLGIRDVCELLAERAVRLGKTIWIADHLVTENSLFSLVRWVVKDEGGSRIA